MVIAAILGAEIGGWVIGVDVGGGRGSDGGAQVYIHVQGTFECGGL